MKTLRYIGIHDAVVIRELEDLEGVNPEVKWGATIDVEDELAERMLQQPVNWQLAGKRKPTPAPEPAPAA